jgi:hypothetical protein
MLYKAAHGREAEEFKVGMHAGGCMSPESGWPTEYMLENRRHRWREGMHKMLVLGEWQYTDGGQNACLSMHVR